MLIRFYKKNLIFIIIFLLIGTSITNIAISTDSLWSDSQITIEKSNAELRNIMVTGYWNPTGQMIAPFSNNTYLNPGGWKGANWEGLGYNIYSYFPKPGSYNGTFEVDYQDTWEDFWNITEEIKPIAIISFGAGAGPWEIEYNARNLNSWVPDNKPPYQPTPCPPDHTKPAGYVRHSTLPVQSIADAVNNQTIVTAWIDWSGNPGAYLCEYMAYLGMWYQDIYNDTSKPYYCLASGFIHVSSSVPLKDAMEATNVTIREVIKYLLSFNYPPDKPSIDGPIFGDVGTKYNFNVSAIDPDGDNVSFYIEWGDGNIEDWIGPYESGGQVSINHTWLEKGSYTIRVKAKDKYGFEGPWGSLEILIGAMIEIGDITGGLFKINAFIKNLGRIDANNINWSIILTGRLILLGKETTGIIDIPAGDNITVTSKLILGFGPTSVTVTTNHSGTSDTKKREGFLVLFFIYLNPGGII